MATLDILRGFQTLEMKGGEGLNLKTLVSDKIGMVETILSPHATLAGKTLRQLHFREKFGLNVLAIWRRGRAHATNLRDMAIDFGDALLLYGPREKLNLLGKENDFIVLTQSPPRNPRNSKKAPLSSILMAATFVPVILGWIPIYIATVIGAALMVLFKVPDHGGGVSCHRVEGGFSDCGNVSPGNRSGPIGSGEIPGGRGGDGGGTFRTDRGHAGPVGADVSGHLRHSHGCPGAAAGPHYLEHQSANGDYPPTGS